MSDDERELDGGGADWDEPEIDPFTKAWQRGMKIAGESYFYDRGYVTSYRSAPPNVVGIKKSLETLPAGTAIFLAALVSFYNGETGGKMLRTLQAAGLGDISARLNQDQRQVLADLLLAYTGW